MSAICHFSWPIPVIPGIKSEPPGGESRDDPKHYEAYACRPQGQTRPGMPLMFRQGTTKIWENVGR